MVRSHREKALTSNPSIEELFCGLKKQQTKQIWELQGLVMALISGQSPQPLPSNDYDAFVDKKMSSHSLRQCP